MTEEEDTGVCRESGDDGVVGEAAESEIGFWVDRGLGREERTTLESSRPGMMKGEV